MAENVVQHFKSHSLCVMFLKYKNGQEKKASNIASNVFG